MSAGRPKRVEVRYPKGPLYVRAASHLFAMAILLVILSLFAGAGGLQLGLLAAVFILYLLIVDISPLLTDHWLTRSRLVLRHGLLFKAILRLSNVVGVERTEEKARVGVKFALRSARLFVTSSPDNLILIRLREPQKFRLALGKRADEVVINVADREEFLEAVWERLALFAPIEPKGPDADLWDERHLALVD